MQVVQHKAQILLQLVQEQDKQTSHKMQQVLEQMLVI